MDIYLQNFSPETSHHEIRLFLRPKLREFNVYVFDVVKRRGQTYAILTIAEDIKAQAFIEIYSLREALMYDGCRLFCSQSRIPTDPLKIRALLAQDKVARLAFRAHPGQPSPALPSSVVPFNALKIGVWIGGKVAPPVFRATCRDIEAGTVTFGTSALVLCVRVNGPAVHVYDPLFKQLVRQNSEPRICRIDIPYACVKHVFITQIAADLRTLMPSLTFTLKTPPKIYELTPPGINLKPLRRLCTLTGGQETTALSTVYRLTLPPILPAINAVKNFASFKTGLEQYCFTTIVSEGAESIEDNLRNLGYNLATHLPILPFDVRFQLLALIREGNLTPISASTLIAGLQDVFRQYGSDATAYAIRQIGCQMSTSRSEDSVTSRFSILADVHSKVLEYAQMFSQTVGPPESQPNARSYIAKYRAVVTPTGLRLRGPDMATPNRVLRKYSNYNDYFLRASFADEDGRPMIPGFSDCTEVYNRFKNIGRNGLYILDRRYEFLGFSHSSLRDHTAWFMAPFLHQGKAVLANDIIKSLGDFEHFRCVAKCAARIGQAFSDTMLAIPLPAEEVDVVEGMADVERNGRCFSDGCGTISQELLEKVWKALPRNRRAAKPTVLQIRYKGAKGVVSLDTYLTGQQLCLRKSMIKFEAGDDWRDLEICDASYSPLDMFLNHQFIKILEDLGVRQKHFMELQAEEVGRLKDIDDGPNAANVLKARHCATAANMPELLKLLHLMDISYQIDPFFTGIMDIAVTASLRDMKYRARIPVKKGMVLFGIMDETNTLKEGEVYIQTTSNIKESKKTLTVLVQGRVVVTRAPALHPGDIQVVSAVDVPRDSPLKALYNCIVFSQQGARDMPSQLGGGDLDGDQYHIIYDERLIPSSTVEAAHYLHAVPKEIPGSVTRAHISDFLIDFMQSDRLGQISTEHKLRADAEPEGTRHPACIRLAQMGSDAVDFSKSGTLVDMSQRPPGGRRNLKPDFMAPRPDIMLVDKRIVVRGTEFVDPNNPDSVDLLDPDAVPTLYYPSDKVLGTLYRAIDLNGFITQIQRDLEEPRRQLPQIDLMNVLKSYIEKETIVYQWEHHREFAEEIRELYSQTLLEIMQSPLLDPTTPLQELEVITGTIINTSSRCSTHAISEAQSDLRQRYNSHVSSCIHRIVYGGEKGDLEEALPRAITCFRVALETEGWEGYEEVESWRYVAAAVCLEELWRERGCRLRPVGLGALGQGWVDEEVLNGVHA